MRVALVEIAKPFIKSLARGNTRRIGFTQSPFPRYTSGVSRLLEHLGNRKILRLKRHPSLVSHTTHNAHIIAHPRVPTVQTRHQNRARWRADRRSGITLREPHGFRRKLVQSGGGNNLLPITTQIAIANIITENKNNVGQ